MIQTYLRRGTFYPNDLAMLQRVFDEVCADGNHAGDGVDAEIIASTLLSLFQCGTTDEATLLTKMRSRQPDFIRNTG